MEPKNFKIKLVLKQKKEKEASIEAPAVVAAIEDPIPALIVPGISVQPSSPAPSIQPPKKEVVQKEKSKSIKRSSESTADSTTPKIPKKRHDSATPHPQSLATPQHPYQHQRFPIPLFSPQHLPNTPMQMGSRLYPPFRTPQNMNMMQMMHPNNNPNNNTNINNPMGTKKQKRKKGISSDLVEIVLETGEGGILNKKNHHSEGYVFSTENTNESDIKTPPDHAPISLAQQLLIHQQKPIVIQQMHPLQAQLLAQQQQMQLKNQIQAPQQTQIVTQQPSLKKSSSKHSEAPLPFQLNTSDVAQGLDTFQPSETFFNLVNETTLERGFLIVGKTNSNQNNSNQNTNPNTNLNTVENSIANTRDVTPDITTPTLPSTPLQPTLSEKIILVNDGWTSSEAMLERYKKIDDTRNAFLMLGNPRDVPFITDPQLLLQKEGWLKPLLYTGYYKPRNFMQGIGRREGFKSSNELIHLKLFLMDDCTESDMFMRRRIVVPCRYLSAGNVAVTRGVVWGTDVYTDDSDIYAAAVHTGMYTPFDMKGQGEGVCGVRGWDGNARDDLLVTIRIVPKLKRYFGSERFGVGSRWWGGGHDGYSYRVEECENVRRACWTDMLKEWECVYGGELGIETEDRIEEMVVESEIIGRMKNLQRGIVV